MTNTVQLLPVTQNPFDLHPEFKTIWPEFSSSLAQEVIAESIEKQEDGIYIILVNDNPAGITGFFDLKYPDGTYWGLRWHGLLPQFRGQGNSEKAICIVVQELKKHHPEVQSIVEYIPHTEYSSYIFKHFEKLGFEPLAEPETVDWAPHKIQAYGVDLDDFIYLCVKKGIIPKSKFSL